MAARSSRLREDGEVDGGAGRSDLRPAHHGFGAVSSPIRFCGAVFCLLVVLEWRGSAATLFSPPHPVSLAASRTSEPRNEGAARALRCWISIDSCEELSVCSGRFTSCTRELRDDAGRCCEVDTLRRTIISALFGGGETLTRTVSSTYTHGLNHLQTHTHT